MRSKEEIFKALPYRRPFLFVDEILKLDQDGVEGYYQFKEDEYFYQGHFIDNPVTPGVILTECMAQIGLVALGMYLLGNDSESHKPSLAFTASDVEFLAMVHPGESVKVIGEKILWRLGKLKVRTAMYNEREELVCRGVLSGIIKKRDDE